MNENNFMCKHFLPCGWCELKNKICDINPRRYPNVFENDPPSETELLHMISVYAAPVTMSNGVSYDKT